MAVPVFASGELLGVLFVESPQTLRFSYDDEDALVALAGQLGPLIRVRPAWAHSCGCKSRRKLITANEVKRNCVRVTERGKEAWSISCEPMNKNRIRGATKQGERA